METWSELEKCVDAGLVRSIGKIVIYNCNLCFDC